MAYPARGETGGITGKGEVVKWLLIFLLSCLTGCAGFSFIRTPLGPMEDRVPQEYRAVFATQLV
jgi:hypothetical protein